MPLQATSGAASYDAFGGGVPAVPNYIEEVFSTYIYNGNGSTQTITNGIDLSTKGGLVWIKPRNYADTHALFDTNRGVNLVLRTQGTNAQATFSNSVTAFNTDGFSLGANGAVNDAPYNLVSWTFRKQPKFFDVVTYTGTGSNTTIAHSLGAVPGSIIVKRTDTTADWAVYHRSLANTQYLVLNTTAAAATGATWWNSTTPTSAVFSVGTDASVNASGGTYVAYIFAHDAGGFGLTGTDNVISCGSYVGDGSGDATVNLGWEPQFLLTKLAETFTEDWRIFDTMRGWDNSTSQGSALQLVPNSSAAETTRGGWKPTATGFQVTSQSGGLKVIYIAIRRGPMKVPTSGTSVFQIDNGTNNSNNGVVSTNFPVDMSIFSVLDSGSVGHFNDRLRGYGNANSAGVTPLLTSPTTSAESSFSGSNPVFYKATNSSITRGSNGVNAGGVVGYFYKRAPSFFDEVCYTGTGANRTVTHNLAAVPEMIIVKNRVETGGERWTVYTTATTATKAMYLDGNSQAVTASVFWNNTDPTATVFSVGTAGNVNTNAQAYVAYLFATCAGVSKVGSYTGTATTKQIDCGFTGGARFVLIKRTDSTGDWYVWDTARGIVSGNDPYLLLNSTAAEVTNTDYIDTYSAGFELSSTAPAALNASGGTYIFLAIA